MKIAIIEDRISRLEQYAEFDLNDCETVSIITGFEFDSLILTLSKKDTNVLEQYDCIASHRSALSNEIRDVIKEYCNFKKKPLIFFSGGITSSVFKDINFPFLHINSKDFYSLNLKLFINNCEESNTVNLLILQFGKRWKLSLLLNLRNNIMVAQNKQAYKNENPEIEIDDRELIKRIRDLQINSLIKPDLIDEKTDSILSNNDFSTITAEQIQEVKSVINRLINKML
jgi:hypothetical protein